MPPKRKTKPVLRDNVSTKLFSEFVLKRRRELGLRQADLAKVLAKNQSYVTRLETGQFVNLNKIDLDALAKFLQTSREELRALLLGIESVPGRYDKDIISFVRAIADSGVHAISTQEFLSLLKIECSLATQHIAVTKEMIPSLLQQIRS